MKPLKNTNLIQLLIRKIARSIFSTRKKCSMLQNLKIKCNNTIFLIIKYEKEILTFPLIKTQYILK